VLMGRLATVLLFICAGGMTFALDTAKGGFDVLLQIGAGTGLLYLLRWFWWRINAWCEVVAMVSSFLVSLVLLIMNRNGANISTHVGLVITVAITTVCWVITAYVGPQTDGQTLVDFYRKVRPFGPGWEPVRLQAGGVAGPADPGRNIPLALLGWAAGCSVIWSGLFVVGNFLYGRLGMALLLLGVFVGSGLVLLYVIRRLWDTASTPDGGRLEKLPQARA